MSKSFKEMALEVGMSKDYFYLMRRSNKELFKHVYKLGNGDLAKGYVL